MIGTQNRIARWPMVSSDFWRDMRTLNGHEVTSSSAAWKPAALVVESDSEFTLRLEVPGVNPDTLEVDLDGEYLTLSGERLAPAEDEARTILVSEMTWGRFFRRFRLGTGVDREAITASYHDGILEVAVPKRADARPRRIPVSTAA